MYMEYQAAAAPCPAYEEALCREALLQVLSPMGGLNFVRPGMKIVIKANLVSFLKPEAAATTHPALLCALVSLLRERGARVILGDSPGGLFTAPYVDHVYRVTGMEQVRRAGAELNRNFEKAQARLPQGHTLREFTCTAYLEEADAIINFCKLKSHGMMTMSGAVKNMFGAIPGVLKPEYHYRFPDPMDFAHMLIDLNEYFRPALCLMDGVVAMEGNGPTAGTPRPMGFIAASQSPHALDLLGAALMGLSPRQVPTLRAALERGLIPPEAKDLSVFGDWQRFIAPDFRPAAQGSIRFYSDSGSAAGRALGAVMEKLLSTRPQVSPRLCVGCGKCAEICPAKAVTMKGGLPRIRRKSCIRCFCCQEFCPKGAMKVRRLLP